jgi:tetratricopeptide (TPR) repeat protein
MPQDPGYVYALFNPSAEGLVKIGRTSKNPEERAKELSSGTGVPTPFVVIYQAYFDDCTAAEIFVHTLLEDKRVSENREFYRVSNTEAVQAILEAEKEYSKDNTGLKSKGTEKFEKIAIEDQKTSADVCQEIMEIAEEHYWGLGETLEDHEEARIYFQKAVNLGCPEAYWKLGNMYRDGEGGNTDIKKAVGLYKQGSKKGNLECWGELAKYYSEMEDGFSNAITCYLKYYSSSERDKVNSALVTWKFVEFMDSHIELHELIERDMGRGPIDQDLVALYRALKEGGIDETMPPK